MPKAIMESEMEELRKSGRLFGGPSTAPKQEQQAPSGGGLSELVNAMVAQAQMSLLERLSGGMQAPGQQQETHQRGRKWVFRVTERDKSGRIVELTATET